MIKKLKAFFLYIWGKRDELKSMDKRDLLLAKLVSDIHRKRTHTELKLIPLHQIHPIHPLNRDGSIEATKKRVDLLNNNREKILEKRILYKDILSQTLPSVSGIKVLQIEEKKFIAYEGNGRLGALQKVFSKDDGLVIEAEQYFFRNTQKMKKRVNRIRRLHGFAV